jgi:outer membrane receptor protein involved in Fe transport
MPALAAEEITTITVTAEKKAEDIQNVPIAVSAFTGQDLANKQINGFKDLQFNMPSVHFTHGNFGPSNFSIRGIGSAAITTSGDAGVSVNVNDVYLSAPPLTSGNYYDIKDLEVLRGPQSTLFGRNATGGSINIYTNVPDVDGFKSDLEAEYGNFNFRQARGMVNLPLVEGQLALRIAGFWEQREGTVNNIYASLHPSSGSPGINSRQDGRNDYSLRGSLRWTPSDNTTVDVMLQVSDEDDSRIRAQKQMCHTDPSGILGCLPDSLQFEGVNANAGLSRTFPSDIGPLAGTIFQLYTVSGPGADPSITNPATQVVPHSLRTVNNDFNPFTRGRDQYADASWHQKWSDWLTMDALLGFDHGEGKSQQAYTTSPGADYKDFAPYPIQAGTCAFFSIPGCTSRVAAAEQLFGALLAPIDYATYFAGHVGKLPLSGIKHNGIVGLNIAEFADHDKAFDEISGKGTEATGEVRFSTNFDGPVNFQAGYMFLDYRNYDVQYFVDNSGAFDYPGIILGRLLTGLDGVLLSPTQFNSNNRNYHLKSGSAFGEGVWDIVPDTLQLTLGVRYTQDYKHFEARSIIFAGFQPIGTTTAPAVPFTNQNASFDAWTGHAVLKWTPKVDWTDQTQVYLSYARGNRSGGFNPPPSVPGLFPNTFAPETLDSYELGTKNTLPFLGGTLQANLDGWYYNYRGFQVAKIINRQAVNANINTKMYGGEGELLFAPDDRWQFSAIFGYTHTRIGNSSQIDTRSPTGDQSNWTLLKDANGANCAIVNTSGGPAPTATTPGFAGLLKAPATGTAASSPIPGVAAQAYYLNGSGGLTCANFGAFLPAGYAASAGFNTSLSGNEMPNTPKWTLSFGAQYTQPLDGDYNVVLRADYYWNDKAWGTIFNDGADRMKSWDVANASIQLNAPDNLWYAKFWVSNIFDRTSVTGMYVTDPASALFTNVFVGDPRLYGVTVGAHF